MTGNDPNSSDVGGNESNEPSADQQSTAAAIRSLKSHFETARNQPTQREQQAHCWQIWTGGGVIAYTIFTAIIMIASICAARYGAQQADTARRAAWPAIYEGDFRLNPPIASGSGPKRFELEAFFSNEGGSIAIIKERAIGWVAEKSLPAARPSFAAPISERTGLGIPSTNSRRNLFQTERGKSIYIDLTAEQIQQITREIRHSGYSV